MPIPVVCPGCAVKLNAPDAAAGQRLKCPKCKAAITVPESEPEPQFEVVEEEPVPKPKPAAKSKAVVELDNEDEPKPKKKPSKPVVELDDDDEDEPKPKKKAKAVARNEDDDEDEERPRKKKRRDDEDDDEDEKPRKKKKKAAGGDVNLIRNIVGAVVLVILLVVVGFVYWNKFGKKDDDTAPSTNSGDTSVTPPPNNNPPPPSVNTAKVAQVTRALNEWVEASKVFINMVNRVTDAESARRAAQDIEKSADRIQQLTAEVKAIGQLTAAEQAEVERGINPKEMQQVQQSAAPAMNNLLQRLNAAKIPPDIQMALGVALKKYGAANIAFGEAVKQAGGSGPPPSGTPNSGGLAPYTVIRHLAASADGKKFATNGHASGGGPFTPGLRVWDLPSGTPREFRDPNLRPDDPIALSPDGQLVAAYSHFLRGKNEAVITIWNVASGSVVRQAKAPFAGTMPTSLGFTADGKAVVAVSGGAIVTAAVSGTQVDEKRPPAVLSGGEVFVPGLNRVASAIEGDKFGLADLALWDPASGEAATKIPLGAVKNGPREFAVSADGKVAAVCSAVLSDTERSQISLYALPDGKKLGDLPLDEDPKSVRFRKIVLSPDGQFVAAIGVGPQFNAVSVFRVSDMKRIARRTGPESPSGLDFAAAPRFSADGKALYYVQSGNKLARIDTETGQETFP